MIMSSFRLGFSCGTFSLAIATLVLFQTDSFGLFALAYLALSVFFLAVFGHITSTQITGNLIFIPDGNEEEPTS